MIKQNTNIQSVNDDNHTLNVVISGVTSVKQSITYITVFSIY